ncbi:TPA: hypothetical protein ACVNID_005803, partial [Klebsiella pneumoniae]
LIQRFHYQPERMNCPVQNGCAGSIYDCSGTLIPDRFIRFAARRVSSTPFSISGTFSHPVKRFCDSTNFRHGGVK